MWLDWYFFVFVKGKKAWVLSRPTTVHSFSLLTEKWWKRWQNALVWICVWTSITGDILSWLTGQGTDSEGRNKIDFQPWHIYLYYFQQHQASKFYWWQPRDFIPDLGAILSYQMFNTLLVSKLDFFFQENKQNGEDGPQTLSNCRLGSIIYS